MGVPLLLPLLLLILFFISDTSKIIKIIIIHRLTFVMSELNRLTETFYWCVNIVNKQTENK